MGMTYSPGGEAWSFREHLEELRKRLYRIAIAIVVTSIVLFTPLNFLEIGSVPVAGASDPIDYVVKSFTHYMNVLSGQGYDSLTTRFIRYTRDYMLPNGSVLISGGSVSTFVVVLRTTMILAFMITSPYIAYEILSFVWPALYRHERAVVKKYIALGALYIVAGLLIGYFLVAKTVIRVGFFWAESVGAQFYITIQSLIDDVLNSMLGSMLIFLIPYIMIIATELGYLDPRSGLLSNRKLVYVLMWIVLVFFLPDVTAILLFLIFIAVYEPSYQYMKMISGRRSGRT